METERFLFLMLRIDTGYKLFALKVRFLPKKEAEVRWGGA